MISMTAALDPNTMTILASVITPRTLAAQMGSTISVAQIAHPALPDPGDLPDPVDRLVREVLPDLKVFRGSEDLWVLKAPTAKPGLLDREVP